MLSTLRKERGTPVVVISAVPTPGIGFAIRIPGLAPHLTPLVAALASQLFSYHLAVARGLDPDAPRGLTKVTSTL